MASGGGRAAIYARISSDRVGAGLGVARQTEDCEKLAKQLGLRVVATYQDNDISAYRAKVRPGYDQLLRDLQWGAVDAVITWHVDRLTRRPAELERLITALSERPVHTVTSGIIDLATPAGRLNARIAGAVSAHESDHKSARVKRAMKQRAEAGLPGHGGGRRAYGYLDDRVTINEPEAALLREAAERSLSGETMGAIIRDWNRRGHLTVTNTQWRASTLRATLTGMHLAGIREYDGQLIEGTWPAILTRETVERLRAVIRDPARARPKGITARKYLLPGFLVCGVDGCGRKLRSRPRGTDRGYVCERTHLSIQAASLETLVMEYVFAALDGPGLASWVARTKGDDTRASDLQAAIDTDRARIADLAAEKDDGLIDDGEYRTRRARLQDRITERMADLAGLTASEALALVPVDGDLRGAWEGWSLDRRRALLSAVIEDIVVAPARRGVPRFDPGRIDDLVGDGRGIRWRV